MKAKRCRRQAPAYPRRSARPRHLPPQEVEKSAVKFFRITDVHPVRRSLDDDHLAAGNRVVGALPGTFDWHDAISVAMNNQCRYRIAFKSSRKSVVPNAAMQPSAAA